MVKAKRKDRKRIIEILTGAFEHHPYVDALRLQDEKKLLQINSVMSYAYEICKLYGKIVISDDGIGCALILYPDKFQLSLQKLYLDLILLFGPMGFVNAIKILKQQITIKKNYPSHIYLLWFIGVDSHYTNMGIGTDLMKDLIIDANLRKRPFCLNITSGELEWFKSYGFEVIKEINPNNHLLKLPSVHESAEVS